MTFETEQLKRASQKEFLVRIQPRRMFNTVTLVSGNKYYIPNFTQAEYDSISCYYSSGIKRKIYCYCGNASNNLDHYLLNEEDNVEFLDNQGYFYDSTTSRLYVSALDSPTSNIYFYHYVSIHLSKTSVITYSDPTDSTLPLSHFKARITSSSTVGETISNILEGFVSTSSGSMTIENTDGHYDDYIIDSTLVSNSFFKSSVEIWHKLNDTYKKVYQGQISSFSYNNQITFNYEDVPKLLSDTAHIYADPTMNYADISVYDLHDNDINKNIPTFIGLVSPHRMNFKSSYTSTMNKSTFKIPVYENLLKATCIDYTDDPDVNGEYNRLWLCGNYSGTQTYVDTIASYSWNSTKGWYSCTFSSAMSTELMPGDTLFFSGLGHTFGTWATLNLPVATVGGSDWISHAYLMRGIPDFPRTGIAPTSTYQVTRNVISAVVITQGDKDYYCYYGYHYRLLSGAGDRLIIEFADDVESQFPILWDDYPPNENSAWETTRVYKVGHGVYAPDSSSTYKGKFLKCIVDHTSGTFTTDYSSGYWELADTIDRINPQNTQVSFLFRRLYADSADTTPAQVVKYCLERSGITTDIDSYSAVDLLTGSSYVTLVANVVDETWNDLIAKILRSICGIITLNDDYEMILRMIGTYTDSITIDEDDYLLGSKSVSVDYNDIGSKVISYNPDIANFSNADATMDKMKNQALHKVIKVIEHIHCLTNVYSNSIIDLYAAIVNNPRVETNYKIKSKFYSGHVGDKINDQMTITVNKNETDTDVTIRQEFDI